MIIIWGDRLVETTTGQDILGIRGIDQAVELALVNGITTISQRARYFTILTWAIGDYLVDSTSIGFDWDSFMLHLQKVEFVTLAASRLDSEINHTDASGALGVNRHRERLANLINGGFVTFPDSTGSEMLRTYRAPCRTIGLLLDGDETVPYRLSPRGKDIWEVRKERLQSTPVITTIFSGNEISRSLVEQAIPDFSLGSLVHSPIEARFLYKAFMTPWDLGNQLERNQVVKAYDNFNGTITWANEMLASEPASASNLIVRNYRDCTREGSGTPIASSWAECEFRRRCHFALELLLDALTSSLDEIGEATIEQVVLEWFSSFESSQLLGEIWPEATNTRQMTANEAIESVPKQLFVDDHISTFDISRLPIHNKAFAAVALLTAAVSQTSVLRRNGYFDRQHNYLGERAVDIIETAGGKPFMELMKELVEITAFFHLQTTFRKMGAGQKCSLRFFTDGPLLRPTGVSIFPGRSDDRLTNVLRILTDIGELQRANGKFVPLDNGVK